MLPLVYAILKISPIRHTCPTKCLQCGSAVFDNPSEAPRGSARQLLSDGSVTKDGTRCTCPGADTLIKTYVRAVLFTAHRDCSLCACRWDMQLFHEPSQSSASAVGDPNKYSLSFQAINLVLLVADFRTMYIFK